MKVKVWVGTDVHMSTVGQTIEIPDEDVEGLSKWVRDEVIEAYARDEQDGMIRRGWEIVEEEKED